MFLSSLLQLNFKLKNFLENLLKLERLVRVVAVSGYLFHRDVAIKGNLHFPALILAFGIHNLLFVVYLVEYRCVGIDKSLVKQGGLRLFRILKAIISIRYRIASPIGIILSSLNN